MEVRRDETNAASVGVGRYRGSCDLVPVRCLVHRCRFYLVLRVAVSLLATHGTLASACTILCGLYQDAHNLLLRHGVGAYLLGHESGR